GAAIGLGANAGGRGPPVGGPRRRRAGGSARRRRCPDGARAGVGPRRLGRGLPRRRQCHLARPGPDRVPARALRLRRTPGTRLPAFRLDGYLPPRLGNGGVDDEATDDEDGDARSPAPLRVGLGIVLAMLAVVGLLHLAGGRPSVDSSDQLRNAGGLLGAAMAAPLASVAGVVGTAVILTGIGLLGLLLAPGVPMRRVFAAIGAGLRRIAHVVGDLFQLGRDDTGDAAAGDEEDRAGAEGLDELEEEDDLEDLADEPEPEPYGELAGADPAPAAA